MRWIRLVMMGLLCVAGWATVARANDLFEDAGGEDDSNQTDNVLHHGVIQRHDLEGPLTTPDQDWFLVPTAARHSYEARMFSQGADLNTTNNPPVTASFDRVDSAGNVLTAGFEPNLLTGDVAVRWIAPADGSDLLRIVGTTGQNLDATSIYDIELLETTVFVPRWNNSSTQITLFLIQNTTNAAVTGNIDFYQPGGLLQDSQALNVPANGSQILNTSAFPGLAGLSGVAQIAHDGNYGAIIGKAVALEPATGFTFDTAFVSLPR